MRETEQVQGSRMEENVTKYLASGDVNQCTELLMRRLEEQLGKRLWKCCSQASFRSTRKQGSRTEQKSHA